MITDPLSDMLIRIKNGYLAKKSEVAVPYSKIKENIANVLLKEGYLKGKKIEGEKIKKILMLTLSYDDKTPKLTDLVRVSKPGVRIYTSSKNIPTVFGGMGLVILSTPEGIISGKEAKKKGLGGEVICKVW